MAIPTQPTLTTLVTEGLKRAGYPSPSAAQITRGNDWVEEVKADLWAISTEWKPLQTHSYGIATIGVSRYALPEDFEDILTVTLLDGDTGTAQAGAATTLTLAADDDHNTDIIGSLLLITSGTGKGSCSQISGFNTTTKVATVTPAFNTTPAASSGYMIVNNQYKMREEPIYNKDITRYEGSTGMPTNYFNIGQANADSDETGEFELWPAPDKAYGIQLRYYANLQLLDLTGNLMATLYRRWRNLFIQGVVVKSFQNDRDARYTAELKIYKNMLDILMAKDTYGLDMSNLTCTVVDYY